MVGEEKFNTENRGTPQQANKKAILSIVGTIALILIVGLGYIFTNIQGGTNSLLGDTPTQSDTTVDGFDPGDSSSSLTEEDHLPGDTPPSADSEPAPSPAPTPQPTPDSAPKPAMPKTPKHADRATVDYVHDGDTIFIYPQERGRHLHRMNEIKVRLIGMDAPEVSTPKECYGDEATEALRHMLPENSTVWVATDRDPYDRYGRMLLYLWDENGTFINGELVAQGYATPLHIRPNTKYASLMNDLESFAADNNLGLWDACSR